MPDLHELQGTWRDKVVACLERATLRVPEEGWSHRGGKQGVHSEHLSYMLAEMQVLPRTYPDATW
jgi:ring-1,2-phenylacetyl-CoA epoxidase subunit PaaC